MTLRVSIWQQFSSNHSASFTVVGEFGSAEDAERAAKTINDLALAAVEWIGRPENEAIKYDAEHDGSYPPLPPEVAFAAKWDIDWDGGSRYLDVYFDDLTHVASAFERIVFINGAHSAWGADPWDEVISRLGGRAFVDGVRTMDDTVATFVITSVRCVAPDEATARLIEEEHPDPKAGGKVRRDGARLEISDIGIFDGPLIADLRARDCTDITYELTEVKEEDPDD